MADPILLDSGPSERGWHRLEKVLRCPRQYAFSLERAGNDAAAALGRGSLLHVGLAHAYARMKARQEGTPEDAYLPPVDAVREKVRRSVAVGDTSGVDFADEIAAVLSAYAGRYPWERLRVLHVEEPFETTIAGFRYTARFDLVVEEADGRVWIWDHKCLPGSASVETPGGRRTVSSLVAAGTPWRGRSLVQGARLEWTAANPPVDAGVQDVWRLTTRAGQVCEFGHRHPVLTPRGRWVPIRNLRPGDRVVAALGGSDVPDVPDLPDALLHVVGSLVCDGGMKRSSPQYTKNDPEKHARFVDCLRLLGCREDDSRTFRYAKDALCTQIAAHAPVMPALRRLDLLGKGAAEKRLPPVLLALSRRQSGVLLGALWSGDGHAGVRRCGTARLVYASRSRGLCDDVKILLARMGLAATVTDSSVRYKGARRGYHFTTVVGRDSKLRFIELAQRGEVPLIGAPLDALHEAALRARDPRADLFGVVGDLMWDEVASCLFVRRERCWDIEVPAGSNFVADGLVTHNSTSVPSELDAALQGYSLSGQFLGAATIGRGKWGARFGGVRLNFVGLLRPHVFVRKVVDAAPAALASFPATVAEAEARIARWEGRPAAEWPAVFAEQTCRTMYGMCRFRNRCRWG